MKKISLVLFMLFTVISIYANNLNSAATELKNNNHNVYEMIKFRAVSEWGNNHSMVIYTINKQCDAVYACDRLFYTYEEIVMNAIAKWCDGGIPGLQAFFNDREQVNIYEAPVNWAMVEYTAKNQIEAQNAY